MNETGAVVEKGLVLHGCKPPVRVGDVIAAVNDQEFQSCEDLIQVDQKNPKQIIKKVKKTRIVK